MDPSAPHMDPEALLRCGREALEIAANYWSTLGVRPRPMPDVKPGLVCGLIPSEPPTDPEPWKNIFADVEPVVLANNTHWHHPSFFAYFAAANSYPSVVADILSTSIASVGFSWKSSPSMTELEMAMVDWVARAIELPAIFLNSNPGPGGGVIQSTASDATFIAILSARARAVTQWKSNNPVDRFVTNIFRFKNTLLDALIPEPPSHSPIGSLTTFDSHDPSIITRLVGYCSDQAHSSVDKGFMLAGVKMRKIPAERRGLLDNYSVSAATLESAIRYDKSTGLVPFIFVATVGTTNTCGVDSLAELGPVCLREGIWLHVDAAYAGSFALCPEYRYLIDGVSYADSFNFNPHKAMLINFDCSPVWFKNVNEATRYFNVEAEYLKHEYQAVTSDLRHLQIPLGRRFRALKIWFVFRALGITTIQQSLRNRIILAGVFTDLIKADDLFEIVVPPHLGLICFRLRTGGNSANERLVNSINNDGRIHIVAAKVRGSLILRFAICSTLTTTDHVRAAYQVILDVLKKT